MALVTCPSGTAVLMLKGFGTSRVAIEMTSFPGRSLLQPHHVRICNYVTLNRRNLEFTVYPFPLTRVLAHKINSYNPSENTYTHWHLFYLWYGNSSKVIFFHLKFANKPKKKGELVLKQMWILFVCECFHWVFNQGVMLSVPIRYSRQGSPAGCLWTTTPSKKQIMIPHSGSETQPFHHHSLAPFFLFLLHICGPNQINDVRKWN